MIAQSFTSSLLHPLSSGGGTLYGGILGDLGLLTIAASIIASAVGAYRARQCHVAHCWRLAWHPCDVHDGHPVCRHHHGDSDSAELG